VKTIRHTRTLVFYDEPQVFEAEDAIGGHYVGVLVDAQAGRYLVCGVAPDRLRAFRQGQLDLRTLLLDHADDGWWMATAPNGLTAPLTLVAQAGSLRDCPDLPDPDFVLHEAWSEDEALQQARARHNLVLEIHVEPPEATTAHRIRVDTLTGLLDCVQALVKHAYRAANRTLAWPSRRSVDRAEGHLLDVVVPAAPGSFSVWLEAASQPNIYGDNDLCRALERVDHLFLAAATPGQALKTLRDNRGHLAGAYLRLLRFLVDHRTGLRYAWANPSDTRARRGGLTEAQAGPVVEALGGIAHLGSEVIELVGTLEKADAKNKTWGLATDEGLVSGIVRDDGPSLDGLRIGARYRFSCLDELGEIEGTGRSQRTIVLTEREALG